MSLFSETERQIFEYTSHDGTKRYADPGKCFRKFKEITQGKFNEMLLDIQSKDQVVASSATEAVINAAIFAFDIPSTELFDSATGTGWLEVQLVTLVGKFNQYLSELKKSTARSATG